MIPSHTGYERGHATWLPPGLDNPAASCGLLRVDHMPPLGHCYDGSSSQPNPTVIATTLRRNPRSDRLFNTASHGELFEHWWGN